MSTGYKIASDGLAQSETGDLGDIIRDFKNHTSKKFLEVVNDNIESRSDWMKIVFEYHGKFKNKQTNQIWTHEPRRAQRS